LAIGADEVIAQSEQHSRDQNMSKGRCFPLILRQHVEAAGYTASDAAIAEAVAKLDAVRRGERTRAIQIRVRQDVIKVSTHVVFPNMTTKSSLASRYFESERVYPNPDSRSWYDRLVGMDDHKQRLLLELELLLYPERLTAWSQRHYRRDIRACQIMAGRAPLVLLEGDVGCGKTALAETIGDALATRMGGKVHLLKINTQVRGTGMVGEMTDLIVQAFMQAEARADALKGQPLLLLIDEADALAAKRVDQHMHHEDKAGLNTLLQRIDGLRQSGRRIVVLFITNRPDSLDPAVRRRAALRLTFRRPNDEQRAELFRQSIPEVDLSARNLRELVVATGADAEGKREACFTWSDITDRLVPAALRDAYAGQRPLTADDLIRYARELEPTPLMHEE
jgi:SpoVK/Ycf46/Vps4 family AAA+-type ATPase